LSAQARSWRTTAPSCLEYFDIPGCDVKFFGHTWDLNTWRASSRSPYEDEYLDVDSLKRELTEAYGFSYIQIDKFQDLSGLLLSPKYDTFPEDKDPTKMAPMEHAGYMLTPVGWTPMMYSLMIANHLKQRYEIENNMTFDLVVRSRFDLCHRPNSKFSEQIAQIPTYGTPKILCCNGRHFDLEWGLSAIDDTFYFGSSEVMDIVDSFHNSYITGEFWKMIGCDSVDFAYKVTGPNILLYKWCEVKNIMIHDVGPFGFPVVRKSVDIGSWKENFEQIKNKWLGFHE
jgi:hypothetical protein